MIVHRVDRRILLVLILVAPSFYFYGCSGLGTEKLTVDQATEITARARKEVLSSTSLGLSGAERALVNSESPSISYYPLAGLAYSDYTVCWTTAIGDKLVVSGQGDILTLQNATIIRAQGSASDVWPE